MQFLNYLLLSFIFAFPVFSGSVHYVNEINNLTTSRYECLKENDSNIIQESKSGKRKFRHCPGKIDYSCDLNFQSSLENNRKDLYPSQTIKFSFEKELNKILISKLLI